MNWKMLGVAVGALAAGMIALGGCEGLPFQQKPAEPQEVGIILLKDRMVPAEVKLVKGALVRLEIMDAGGGTGSTVHIGGLKIDAALTPGKVSTVTLDASQVAKLNGQALSGDAGRGEGRFTVVADERQARPMPMGGKVEVAVVMTDQLAAPRRVTVMRGVRVVMYIVKNDSEIGFDTFECGELGIKATVKDREVKELDWMPEKAGTFVFTGTVTPDSRVNMVVVESGS